jgi:polyisoprenoid-binding protein YceI
VTTAADTTDETTSDGATIFEIVSAESEARFLIDEVLQGSPVTVEGTTDQVAGQIEIDPTNLSTARLGVIQINARTLATDNDFRNRAIKNAILETDANEFITFTPTSITGLPSSGTVGTASTFQVVGDLTIKGVTKAVTFEVTVTPSSTSRIEGTATTTVNYRDFELAIPDSPSVDTVADTVQLELEFVAQAVAA